MNNFEPSTDKIVERIEEWRGQRSPTNDPIFDDKAAKVSTLFASALGQEVLDLILNMSVRRPWASADPIYIAERQGQNGIALGLLAYVKRGKELANERARNHNSSTSGNTDSGNPSDRNFFAAIR